MTSSDAKAFDATAPEVQARMPWYAKALIGLFFLVAMLFAWLLLAMIDDNCRLAGGAWTILYWIMSATVVLPAVIYVVDRLFMSPAMRMRARLTVVSLLAACLLMYAFIFYSFLRTDVWLGSREEPRGPKYCSSLRYNDTPPDWLRR